MFLLDKNLQISPNMIGINYSTLAAFSRCRRSFMFDRMYRHTLDTNPHILFGQAFHLAAQTYDLETSIGNAHELALYAALRASIGKYGEALVNAGHSSKNIFNLVRNVVGYLDFFAKDVWKTATYQTNLLVETTFATQLPEGILPANIADRYFLYGTVDRVVKSGEMISFVDYKTTSGTGEQHIGYKMSYQFIIYQFLIEQVMRKRTTAYFMDYINPDRFEPYRMSVRVESEKLLPTIKLLGNEIEDLVKFDTEFRELASQGFSRENVSNVLGEFAVPNYFRCGDYGGCRYNPYCVRREDSGGIFAAHGTQWEKLPSILNTFEDLEAKYGKGEICY